MNPLNPFPVGYQPYNPYPYQAAQVQPQAAQQQQQIKYVEVIPVNTVQEAESCPMAAGSSFLFFANDDSFIAVKSVGVNGQTKFNVYDQRPPAPAAPAFDPSEYVRRDELQGLIMAAIGAQATPKKTAKREEVPTE